nr:uncharacterized protein LOC113750636 [Ipomoea batatas]GMC83224.1 uncharacterized protein LOC113750636 [Ipomoea batatas]
MPPRWLKLNYDASFGHSCAFGGAYIRDEAGLVVVADLAFPLEASSVVEAKSLSQAIDHIRQLVDSWSISVADIFPEANRVANALGYWVWLYFTFVVFFS